VSPEDYPNVILAPLVKLFASPDRGTRMALLDHLPEYADRLDKKTVSDKIWPNLVRLFLAYSIVIHVVSANWVYGHGGCYSRSDGQVHKPVVTKGWPSFTFIKHKTACSSGAS
jgi:hypothetical protein